MLIFTGIFGFVPNASAANCKAVVHHHANGTPTYTYTKQHAAFWECNVVGFKDANNGNVLTQFQNQNIIVMHTHGAPGLQGMGNTLISGKGGNSGTIKSINTIPNNSAKNMKIAIFYGCSTGVTTTAYGDIAQETVNKGAQASVAWKVDTLYPDVNEWNRLFFEKAKSNNIVESFRHADYWLEQIIGTDRSSMLRLNRVERGNINGYINQKIYLEG